MSAPDAAPDPAPTPLLPGELDAALARLAAGAPFRETLEELLLALPLERAQRLMLLLREGRAAWLPLVERAGGRALFVGNALSGTAPALALAGFEPTLADPSRARLAFGAERCRLAAGRRPALVGAAGALPFADGAFELVVAEPGPGVAPPDLSELARVCGGELALVAENRLAYKRSRGRQGEFAVPGPLAWLGRALRPPAGERSLAGHRRALAAAGRPPGRAFALYPHSQDYAGIAALDAPLPRLRVGPKERANRAKLAAAALGLVPLLTPSFLLLEGRRSRLERLLAALAERLGELAPELEELVATRGQALLAFTRPRGEAIGGRWVVRIPLQPHALRLARRHAQALALLPRRFPGLPVPRLLFEGELEGLWLACEERLPGLSAPQLSGRGDRAAGLLADAARQLALLAGPPEPVDAARFEALVGRKLDAVAARAGSAATRAALARMRDAARERLVGATLPLALSHGDLRGKHVQVRPDGGVVGYLDWGTWEEPALPLFDLAQLLVHERRYAEGLSAEAAWGLARAPERLSEPERAALEGYAARVGLPAGARAAILELHPVLVGAMAETTWDYSRPRWLARQYGLGR